MGHNFPSNNNYDNTYIHSLHYCNYADNHDDNGYHDSEDRQLDNHNYKHLNHHNCNGHGDDNHYEKSNRELR